MEAALICDLRSQIDELQAVHGGLNTAVDGDGSRTVLSGPLAFNATSDGLESITDCFDIELTIPDDYPDGLPWVREIGNRIEEDYEHLHPDGTCCLAVPIEKRTLFQGEPSLLGFVNNLVVPYFYGYSHFKRYGVHPFGEAAHGSEGIVEHYQRSLHLGDPISVLQVLCFLLEHGYRGHHDCPCGSGRKVRKCHGPSLLDLHRHHNQPSLQGDFLAAVAFCLALYKRGELCISNLMAARLTRLLSGVSKSTQGSRHRR